VSFRVVPENVVPEGFVVPDQIVQLLPIVAFALVFWLLLVRPAQRRRKHVASMQSSLGVGDRVMMSSGVFGTVRELAGDRLLLDIAEGVTITVARAAISEVLTADDGADTGSAADNESSVHPASES
jgi:preprotein translocase subunit YajC